MTDCFDEHPNFSPYGYRGVPWDSESSDPIADIRAWRDKIAEQSGYKPVTLTLSARGKEAYDRWTKWFEQTTRILEALPRHRFLTRIVLKRQLWGPWWKRSRRLTRLRWKIRDWRRGEDWDV